MPTPEAVAGGLAKVVIERGAKPGLAKLSMRLRGRTLMVVGPPRAGKSTFMDYLRYGIFRHAQETEVTYDLEKARDLKLTLGQNKNLKASIKTAVDMPGDPNPKWLADRVFKHRPHALVIMLDLSAPLDDERDVRSTAAWLRKFCLAAEHRAHSLRRKNRLSTVVVAMNKADLVEEGTIARNEAVYKQIMDQHWSAASGPNSRDPLFRKCVSVRNAEDTLWIDSVLVDIAKGLARKQ